MIFPVAQARMGLTMAMRLQITVRAYSIVLLLGGLVLSAVALGDQRVSSDRIGLVLSYLNHAMFQTDDGQHECPEGFHFTQNDNFTAQFPSEAEREAVLSKYIYYTNRGPNGENVFYHPTVIQDPLPLRTVQGATGLGLDLDGSVGTNAFTSPEGDNGIDNELFRVIGCIPGWRKGGTVEGSLQTEIRTSTKMRMLVEVSGVDDPYNDESVTVHIYRGRDQVEVGPDNKMIPFRSQRIDYRKGGRYIHNMVGRIIDGTLYTEPTDLTVPLFGPVNVVKEMVIRDARFQLRLSNGGAEGYLGGYFDLDRWYLNFTKMWGAHFAADVAGWSGPATYAGLQRFADHYPDESGRNTAISGAFKVEFVRAFVIHDEGDMPAQGGANTAVGNAPLYLDPVKTTEYMPPGVTVALTDEIGPVFVDADGFTLYSRGSDDTAYESRCNSERYERVLGRGQALNILPHPEKRPVCEQAWPPFRPLSGDVSPGDSHGAWRVIKRHDGSMQWAYKGKPVYRSGYDRQPGQLTGVGRFGFVGGNGVHTPLYAPLALPTGMNGRLTRTGFTLTDTSGYALYWASSACDRECEKAWRPFLAPMGGVLDKGNPTWSMLPRNDGTRQWMYQNRPLFRFAGDTAPGDVNGQLVAGWSPVLLYPPLTPPEGMIVQLSGDGDVYADKHGMTLYAFYCMDEAPDHLPCDVPGSAESYRLSLCGGAEKCAEKWRPVLASKDAAPVGNVWTIVPVDTSGKRLFPENGEGTIDPVMGWAYYGRPVFTYGDDKIPGDILGDNISHRSDWGFWMLRRPDGRIDARE